MKKYHLLVALMMISNLFFSCKKEKEEDDIKKETGSELQSSTDNNKQQSEFDDVMSLSFQAINQELGSSSSARLAALCATVTLDASSKNIKVDFGETGCTYNGITRKGVVNIAYTGHWVDSGSVVTVTLDKYRVQNTYFSQEYIAIEGTQTITNKGVLADGKTWDVVVSGAKITFADGKVSTWSSNRTRVLVAEGSASPFDETYKVYGNANGVDIDGLAYVATIPETDPLVFDFPCWFEKRMFTDGKIIVKPEGKVERSVDYGYQKTAGTACDRSVTVTYGQYSINVDL